MTEHDEEVTVIRSAPEALDHPEHGRVYLVPGSLVSGTPKYAPDAERYARWLAGAPERERLARRFASIQAEIERERTVQMRLAL